MKISMTRWIPLIAIAALAMGCAHHRSYNLPPAQQLMEPGPGVGGPGPGVLAPPPAPTGGPAMMGVAPVGMMMPAGGLLGDPNCGPMGGLPMGPPPTVQILFAKPEAMMVAWDVGGVGYFDSEPLVVPGRYSFPTGGIYRLKITNLAGREGVERYPTLEVGPITYRTEAYLAHNAIPIQFTDEDFDQVAAGNFVTKVIYLPDPEFQELALAGVETLVSTRLDPGIDPIVEADRRGSILAIIRMGNKDLEVPGAVDAGSGGVMPAGGWATHGAMNGMACGAMGPGGLAGQCYRSDCPPSSGMYPGGVVPYGNVPSYLSGVTTPQWGMPISGTPIGLPGPPHVPLGVPAGLQKHVIKNHTRMHIPEPVEKFKVHVRQQPGYSYPAPPTRMRILEQNIHPPLRYGQTHDDANQCVR
ncbi:MAG: hypothetical protein MUF48_20395 [Pirellulaceae bacterium]|jgi:hypothetical protein|nr:hypothetical protein [Pirellulaceae bacterium]